MHVEIIRKIGLSIGDFIGLDASFKYCNNIKNLINCKVNNLELKPIKVIKNRAIYNLNYRRCEGKILEIIRLDNDRKIFYQKLQLTIDLKNTFPVMYIRNQREYQKEPIYEKDHQKTCQDTARKIELVLESGAVRIDKTIREIPLKKVRNSPSLTPKKVQDEAVKITQKAEKKESLSIEEGKLSTLEISKENIEVPNMEECRGIIPILKI